MQAYLVNEQHTRNNGGLALFPPFCNLRVNLLTNFGLDLSGVACKYEK
jgi:hypothetical protein